MAKKDKSAPAPPEEAEQAEAVERVEQAEASAASWLDEEPEADEDDLGDDLMDLFVEDDTSNEEMARLLAMLDDVEIDDLSNQVRDVRGILDSVRRP